MDILRTLVLICIAGWLAISTFFSFAVAPLAFRVIDRAVAGQLVAAVLPRYYDWGVVLCVIALTASAVQAVSGRRPRGSALAGGGLCALMFASCCGPRSSSCRAPSRRGAPATTAPSRWRIAHRSSSTV